MQVRTTVKTLVDDAGPKMTGKERYLVAGKMLSKKQADELMTQCAGLLRHWDCIAKAKLVQDYLGYGQVVVGSCQAFSCDGMSGYGHFYNPPFELHAWWQPRTGTPARIDIALPGLIEMGLKTKDAVGVILSGRKPIILAGIPQQWMRYVSKEVIN